MTRKRSLLAIAAFLAVFGVICLAGWKAYSPSEQHVYSDLFRPLLLDKQKIDAVAWSHPSKCMKDSAPPGVSLDLWESFAAANDSGTRPLRLYSLEGTVPVVGWETNDRYYTLPSEIMQSKLPNERPLAGLSRVGFSRDGRYALICVEIYRQGFAQGDLFHLESTNGTWNLVAVHSAWVT